jgi:hypothetical protein
LSIGSSRRYLDRSSVQILLLSALGGEKSER